MHLADCALSSGCGRNALGDRYSMERTTARHQPHREAACNSVSDLSFRAVGTGALDFRWLSSLLHGFDVCLLDKLDGADANADIVVTTWRARQKLYRSKPR